MKKKGFTLVELLVVIAIIALLSIMGTVGVSSLKKAINNSLWQTNIDFIENAAAQFGEDKKSWIINNDNNENKTCKIDGNEYTPCVEIQVQTLIDKNYLNSKERINYENNKNFKVIINPTVDKVESDDKNFENGYYVNNNYVCIYIENNIAYAKYIGKLDN